MRFVDLVVNILEGYWENRNFSDKGNLTQLPAQDQSQVVIPSKMFPQKQRKTKTRKNSHR